MFTVATLEGFQKKEGRERKGIKKATGQNFFFDGK